MEATSSHALILDLDVERSGRIADILRGQGYTITQMQGVGVALGVCARVPFSLLIVGDLPRGQDRREVCRALRQMSNSALVVLVAEPDPAAVISLLDAGASDVLPPYSLDPERFLLRILVTERRAAAQSHAEAMLRAMPDLVFRIRGSGEFLSFHAVSTNDLFSPEDRIVGRVVEDVLPPSIARLCRDAMKRALDTGELQILTYSLDLPLGPRDYEARVVQSGPDEVLAIVRNITDRTQAESLGRANLVLAAEVAERRRAEDALRTSEAQWRSLVESCPDFVVMIDRAARITFVNRPFADVDGGGLGKTIFELAPPHSTDRLRLSMDRVFNRGELDTLEITTDPTTHVAYEVRVAPIAGEGAVSRAVILARDITERRAAEADRARMQERLLIAQKNDSLGMLAGGVAHDFNNLLTAILGSASIALLKLDEGDTPPAHRAIETLVSAARRATELTQQLLAYSGRGKFEVRGMDMSAQIRELVLVLEAAIPKQIELRLELDPELPAIQADVGQMQQVVMNLVINAAEAIGERPGTIRIATGQLFVDDVYAATVSAGAGDTLDPGDHVFLEVSDDGCGMDPETFAKVFDPFFSTKGTGRGLGLAAVQGIVRSHRGAMQISSTKGRGTTFRVVLPASGAVVEERAPEGPPSRRAGGTVLVVDDEALLRRAARQIIEHFGYTALEAEDGLAAVEIFRKHAAEISIVLLDMTMPGLSGEETFHELCQIRPDVSVVLSSGYNELEATRRFNNGEKLAAFLQKPYTAEQLGQCLARVTAAMG